MDEATFVKAAFLGTQDVSHLEGWAFEDALSEFQHELFESSPSEGRLLFDDGTDGYFKVVDTKEIGGLEGLDTTITWQVGDRFYSKEGAYFSHYGNDWDGDFYESKPVKVTAYKRKGS